MYRNGNYDGSRGAFVYIISGIIVFNFFTLMWVSKLWLLLWYNLEDHWRKILGLKYHRCGIWEWKHTSHSGLSGFSKPAHSEGSLPPNRALHKCWLCHYAVFQKLHQYIGSLKAGGKPSIDHASGSVSGVYNHTKVYFYRLLFNPINFESLRKKGG